MAKIILKCPYIQGNGKSQNHVQNYINYIGTRERAERIPIQGKQQMATPKQVKMAEKIANEFPLSRALESYEEYRKAPTVEHATRYITQALDENADAARKKEIYIAYISSRPRAEKIGTHALFSAGENEIDISQVAREVAQHPGNIWLPIISLRREDAERLGYDNAQQWKDTLSSYAPKLARNFKIPLEEFRWYAAFHNEGDHPHIHMVCYSADGHSGYLSKGGINQIKKDLAAEIFQNELLELYTEKGKQRDALVAQSRTVMHQMIEAMKEGTLQNTNIEMISEVLIERLQNVTGKKCYGYLPPDLKNLVDGIVDELEKDERISTAYAMWYQLKENVINTYQDKLPERLPLSKQPELKQIRNAVIRELVKIGENTNQSDDDLNDKYRPSMNRAPDQNTSIPLIATKLMIQIAKIFESKEPQRKLVVSVDKKLREKIREQKIASGHREDDHEDERNNIALVE